MGAATQPEYGPSLPELAGPRWRSLRAWQKLALGAVLLAFALAGVAYYLNRRSTLEHVDFAGSRATPSFQLDHPTRLRRVAAQGSELVRLETRRGGDLTQRFAISPLRFERRPGLVSGRLPLDAIRYRRAAERRYGSYRPVLEGATRLAGTQAYQLVFTTRTVTRAGVVRQLLGRIVLLPEEAPRPSRGLVIELLATTAATSPNPLALGNEGDLSQAFRNLELG